MEHTRFEPNDQTIPALAKGYVLHDGAADPKQAAEDLKSGRGYKVPNGAVFTTVSDMARFVSFEMGYGPESVLSKTVLLESQAQMFWAQEDAAMGYGIGLMLVRRGDVVALGHGGLVPASYPASILTLRRILESSSCATPKGTALIRSSSSAC